MARKTTQEFVEQAQQVHGDQFEYSEVEYSNTHTPVKIRCKQCGLVFFQEPSSHLAGCGCPKCSKKQTHKRVNQDMFIAGAREVHGDKYDYSKTFMRKTLLNKAISRRVLAAAYRGTAETLFSSRVFSVA